MGAVGTLALAMLVGGAHIGTCAALTALLARPGRDRRAGRHRSRS